jgi:hypothetical protein
MPSGGIEPAILAIKWSQTYALDRNVAGIDNYCIIWLYIIRVMEKFVDKTVVSEIMVKNRVFLKLRLFVYYLLVYLFRFPCCFSPHFSVIF